jgi:hypothetical protein
LESAAQPWKLKYSSIKALRTRGPKSIEKELKLQEFWLNNIGRKGKNKLMSILPIWACKN